MPTFRAAWVLPISQPAIHDGWVRVVDGRISGVGARKRGERAPSDEIDLGDVALLPGLVNAHTHLELSWMRGRVAGTANFPAWIRSVIALQRSGPASVEIAAAATRAAIADARATGTVLFGDISNTLSSIGPLAESHAAAVVFLELIAFRGERAAAVVADALRQVRVLPSNPSMRYSLAAHAPYSVSAALFQELKSGLARESLEPCSVHLGESAAETQFLRDASGPWRALLEDLGSWDASWVAPHCDPVEYLDRLGFMDEKVLVVHGVQLREPELAHLASIGATLVTCPRGNQLTGAGVPPVAAFYASRARVAVGTDSLASVPDLNLFSELAELRRLAPEVAADALLESATLHGARALGFESDYGSLEAGKCAALVAVALPSAVRDAAEYLVNGIAAADISNIDESSVQ